MRNGLVLSLLLTLSVSLLFSPDAFSEETVVRVDVLRAVLEGEHDNPYIVDIFIENGHNVAGYQVMLQFDSSDFQASGEEDIEIDYGDYLPQDTFSGKLHIIDDDPKDSLKVILFAATSRTSESNGDGLLARLTFKEGTTRDSKSELTLLDGTLLSNRAGETSVPRFENSKTFPDALRDLVVESVQAIPIDDQGNPTGETRMFYDKDEKFQLRANVKNIGNVLTKITDIKLYGPAATVDELDTTIIALPDEIVQEIQSIAANDTVDIYLSDIDALASNGTYYFKVCVSARAEDDSNNCSIIKIEVEPPDLEVIRLQALSLRPQTLSLTPQIITTVLPGEKFVLQAAVGHSGRKSEQTLLWW